MHRSLVIGASGGIGSALCDALDSRGGDVTRLSRSQDGLDVTDEASVADHLGRLDAEYDLILTATGALEIDGAQPEKTLRDLTPQAMLDQFTLNTIGPAMVLKHSLPLIPRGRRAVIATLSARVGSIADNRLGGWYSYRTAKAAVNQIVHSAAIEIARSHRHAIVAALHPGTVATPFTARYLSRHPSVPPEEAAVNLLNVMENLAPDDTGGFFDWAGERLEW